MLPLVDVSTQADEMGTTVRPQKVRVQMPFRASGPLVAKTRKQPYWSKQEPTEMRRHRGKDYGSGGDCAALDSQDWKPPEFPRRSAGKGQAVWVSQP